MKAKVNNILYMVIVGFSTVSMIPGFVVGSVLYMVGALVLSILGKSSVGDYIAMYIFGVKAFIEHCKENFWKPAF